MLKKFLNSDARIRLVSNENGIKKFNILFPKKKGVHVDYSGHILKSILKDTYAYVYINTSLCFTGVEESKQSALNIRKLLQDCEIEFNHRTAPDTSNRDSIFGLVKLSKTKKTCNIITFIIPKNFDNENLVCKLTDIGCNIYVPKESDDQKKTLEKLFLEQFEEETEKEDYFKYSIFLTNYITQSTITTKYLEQSEIEKIFLDNK